ncbi:hypothetical protein ACFPOU_23355 [Massilia jejuensis]|uniref:Uncharacterized protein n=1 Tax=Massilia jejuensis TaxID=648894 RepID=A0ABW0PNG0_9BURK
MNPARQTFVRLAAVAALTAASGAALAQSMEYRRGYDDGYAAGLRAAHVGGDRGHRWDRLYIEDAEYGARGQACDARQAVRMAVERNGGMVRVDNGLCGDPLVGAPKRLVVVYRCGRGEPLRISAREHDILRLSCQR